jgi:predicted RNA-binding protein
MCELEVYTVRGDKLEKAMEGVVKLTPHDGKILLEGIFGDSLEVEGKLSEVNIIAKKAIITVG